MLKGLAYVPRVIITDKLAGYSAAKDRVSSGVEHSHRPTRERERRMRRFKSPGHAQRFLAAYGPIPAISARAATASPLGITTKPATAASPLGAR